MILVVFIFVLFERCWFFFLQKILLSFSPLLKCFFPSSSSFVFKYSGFVVNGRVSVCVYVCGVFYFYLVVVIFSLHLLVGIFFFCSVVTFFLSFLFYFFLLEEANA